MDLHSETQNDIQFITVNESRIDAAAAIRFKDSMRALTDGGGDHIVLNLENVTFVDSSGLGAIVAAMKQLGPRRRLDLAGLTPDVDKVFRLTRMDSVFVIHKDLAKAGFRNAG